MYSFTDKTIKRTKRIEFVLMYMKICLAILTRPQNKQNEYTFAFISMYSYIALLTQPQNEQNE